MAELETPSAPLVHTVVAELAFDRETYERWRAQERPLVEDIEHEGVPF